MKKLVMTVAALSLLAASSTASAQTIVTTPNPSVKASLLVQQTLPFPIPCIFASPAVSTFPGVTTNFPASVPVPHVLCWYLGNPIEATSEYSIDPVPGSWTSVTISNITANALAGTCGPGTVKAIVVDQGPPLRLYIPRQSIPGNPVDCWIEGDVVINNAELL